MISCYVIGWFYCTVNAYCMLQQVIVFYKCFDKNNRSVGHKVTLLPLPEYLIYMSLAGGIGHRVADRSPPLRHFFKRSYAQPERYAAENEPSKLVTRFDVIKPE